MDVARLDSLARTQHGLLTTAQAVDVLGRSRKERMAASGMLGRVQPGVWRLAGTRPTWHQQLAAAQLSSGGRVSHRAAGEIWAMTSPRSWVEASVRSPRQPVLWAPAILHTIVDLTDAHTIEREGLLVTTPARTLIDLGLVLPRAGVERALLRSLGSGLLSLPEVRELREQLSRCGRTGVGIIGDLLDALPPGATRAESPLELRFLKLAHGGGLPTPAVQHEIWHHGRFVARVDAAYPELRIAIELDGYEWHTGRTAFQRDRTRQNELVGLGWIVLRFTWADVADRPEQTIDTIRQALARSVELDSECA